MGAFFTATSMIGFIAGGGIVVRNSIILVDFIELRRAQGLPLTELADELGGTDLHPQRVELGGARDRLPCAVGCSGLWQARVRCCAHSPSVDRVDDTAHWSAVRNKSD